MKRNAIFLVLILLFNIAFCSVTIAQTATENDPVNLVKDLYRLVSVEKGQEYDWTKVRALFHDQATVVLRTSRTGSTVFTADGFVDDFKKFVNDYKISETGFTERIIKIKPFILGDIAHLFVVYEALIPGADRPPQKGLDSISLIKSNGEWKIISITNEIPTPERPLPDELKK